MLKGNKMTEAEVSLRLGFYLIEQRIAVSDVEVAIDGAQVQTMGKIHFPIVEFLKSKGWKKLSVHDEWQGFYEHFECEYKLKIHSSPGQGDVVARLKSGQTLRAESKKGPLSRSKSSQEYSLIRGALGQLLTVKEVVESDLFAVVVPSSHKFDELASRWREAPLIKRVGFFILTVNRCNEVKGFPV